MPTTHPPKRVEKASDAAGVGGARRKPKAQAKRPRQDDEDDSDEDPSDGEDVLGEVPAGAGQADGESYADWAGRVGCTLCEDCSTDESPTMILSPFMWCGVGAHGLRAEQHTDGGGPG